MTATARILVVDKETDFPKALARAVASESCEIEVAPTDAAALAAAKGEPAVVFVRISGGVRAAARLVGRLRARHPTVPVACVAADPSGRHEITLRRKGILCYLQEPVDERILRQVVRGAACAHGAAATPISGGTESPRLFQEPNPAAKGTGE